MSQDDIDAFVASAYNETLMPEGVMAAMAAKRLPVSGRDYDGQTALHWAVYKKHRELVKALLAAGADADVKDKNGRTSVWWAAAWSTSCILQQLIENGGSVNEADTFGHTPLSMLLKDRRGDADIRLHILLECRDLDLDAKVFGKTAEQLCDCYNARVALAEARLKRSRWGDLRVAWIRATATYVVK
jgi:hypothetical protein